MSNTAETTPDVQIPEDFAQYERWRTTGELPQAAAGEEPAPQDPPAGEEPKSAEESGAPKKEQEQHQKPKGNSAIEKRMSELTRARREAERRAEEAEARLARIQAGRPAEAPQPQPTPQDPPKPRQEDFKTYDEFTEALADWKIDQRERTRAAEDRKRSDQESLETKISSFREKVETFRGEVEDFDEVLEAAPLVSQAMRDVILDSEVSAQLSYELAKNPDEIRRIAKLSPLAAARELGRIEARIQADVKAKAEAKAAEEAAPEPQLPQISRAPAPPRPVKPKSTAERSIHDENLSYGEWEKLRNKQLYG